MPLFPTHFDRFLKSRGIYPKDIAHAAGVLRKELFRLRFKSKEDKLDPIPNLIVGIALFTTARRLLREERLTFGDLFDLPDDLASFPFEEEL